MKGEKKETKNKRQLYLLALCGVLAISGAVYAGTRKNEPDKPDKPGKELVDLNEKPGDQSLPEQDGKNPGGQTDAPEPTAGGTPGTGQSGTTGGLPGGTTADGKDQSGWTDLKEPSGQVSADGKNPGGSLIQPDEKPGGTTASGQDGSMLDQGTVASGEDGKTAPEGDEEVSGQGSKTASGEDGSSLNEEPSEAVNNPTADELKFNAEEGLCWPLSGNVVKSYSADRMVYFDTLQQFRTNPAIFIAGEPGAEIVSSADGIVLSVGKEDKLGQTLTLEIGGGYRLVYGQLADVKVSEGDYVKAGTVLARLAPVTKYYRLEGNHLYFQVQKDESTVNPLTLIRQSEE